jgi:hypothetical protein
MDKDIPDSDPCAAARRNFPGFYLLASVEDELMMDGLVMVRAALLPVINAPRHHAPKIIRDGLERTADAVERSFTDFREAVRACPTFARIDDEERELIERLLFEISAPEAG